MYDILDESQYSWISPKSSAKSKEMAFDWGPVAGAGLGGVFSLFGSIGQREAQNNAFRMQNLMQNAAIEEARNARYGDLANQMAGRVASLSWGPELDLARQFEARKFQLGPEVEKMQAARKLQYESDRAFAMDPRSRELAAQERRGRMEEEAFKNMLPGAAAFGPTAPFAGLAGKYGIFGFTGGK